LNPTRNALWLTVCRLTGDVLNLLLFVAISRQLGPAGAGAYSYGFAVATFGFVIACLGIEEYGLRQFARLDDARRPAFLGELLGTQVYMVVGAIAALAVYLAVTGPSKSTLILVSALAFYQITAALAPTLFIPAMAQQRMMGPALAELTARTVAFSVAGVGILILHVPLEQAVLGFPFAALVWFALALRSARHYAPAARVSVTAAGARRIVATLWSFALLEIFAQPFTRIGVISLSLGMGDAQAGVFATGLRLIEVALMPLSFFGMASYPRLSRLYSQDLVAFRRPAGDLLLLMGLGGAAVAWGLYFVAPLLLVPVLGQRFAGAEPVVQMMALLALAQAVEVGLGRIMLSADRQTPNAVFIAFGAVIGLVLNAVLIPHLGINGAIYAGVAAYVSVDILCIRSLQRPLGARVLVRMVLTQLGGIAAAAGVAAVLAMEGFPNWLRAVGSGLVIGAVALGSYKLREAAARADDPHWQDMPERR